MRLIPSAWKPQPNSSPIELSRGSSGDVIKTKVKLIVSVCAASNVAGAVTESDAVLRSPRACPARRSVIVSVALLGVVTINVVVRRVPNLREKLPPPLLTLVTSTDQLYGLLVVSK